MAQLNTMVLVVATTLVGCSITLPALGAKTLLRCTVKDAVTLQDDGTLSRDGTINARSDDYIVDITTGAVRLCSRAGGACTELSVRWIVADRGDEANDAVLVSPRFAGKKYELKYAATDFIRIRQWKGQEKILFLRYSLSTLASGTCRSVK